MITLLAIMVAINMLLLFIKIKRLQRLLDVKFGDEFEKAADRYFKDTVERYYKEWDAWADEWSKDVQERLKDLENEVYEEQINS